MRGTSWLLALVVATARGGGERARVAVVGGGPGGALTAILLARQERLDVTLGRVLGEQLIARNGPLKPVLTRTGRPRTTLSKQRWQRNDRATVLSPAG